MEVRDVTYADLRDGDIVEDKSGKRWLASGPGEGIHAPEGSIAFMLGPIGGVPLHLLTKPLTDPVRVVRDEWVDDRPAPDFATDPVPDPEAAEAVAVVTDAMPAEVVAHESKPEESARTEAAASGRPVPLPLFTDMTDLEQKSHLFLLHGAFAEDVEDRAKRATMHDDLHAKGHVRMVAHAHDAANEFPS